jgi:DNA sulfur modification protein DndC
MTTRIPTNSAATGTGVSESAFASEGLRSAVDDLVGKMQALYLSDGIPWVVGYSGGKDSTATLQLVWLALQGIPGDQRHKPVHVITNDTLVENPVVSSWVTRSLEMIADAATAQGLPITPHKLTPEIHDTFWVNLIGRGYPAPNRRFRWCTERMKINPSTKFIKDVVRSNGEAIIVLGARKAESAARAARITKYDASSVRENLSPHNDLASALVYKPIVEWTNDDVWTFLLQYRNPWGFDNKSLMTMYRSASQDAECPVVVDTSTASCGNSRFGCWTCTVVDKDKSMAAMIQNDAEKEWMQPLLDIRDEIADTTAGRQMRDFRRMHGNVSLYRGEFVPGPYTQKGRVHWLRRVLEAQRWVRDNGPGDVADIELITMAELHEIRRIWVNEKHEYEDLLPAVFEEATGEPFPGDRFDDHFPFDGADLQVLEEEADTELQYQLLRELLGIEHTYRANVRRVGIWEEFAKAFNRSGYASADEAIVRVKALTRGRDSVSAGAPGTYEEMIAEVEAGVRRQEST